MNQSFLTFADGALLLLNRAMPAWKIPGAWGMAAGGSMQATAIPGAGDPAQGTPPS